MPPIRSPLALAVLATGAITGLLFASSCSTRDAGPGASPRGAASPTSPRGAVAAAATDPAVTAIGDMVCGTGTPSGTPCKHAEVAALIGPIAPDVVAILGDNQYENGTLADYNAFYGPTYGVYKAITNPSVGNHEYQTPNAQGYYDYFNGVGVQTGRAGDRAKGYYSYDLGAWHVVVVNSNCSAVGGCGAGSPQEQWLRADLAAHPTTCTLAYWHHPRFTSGEHGSDATYQPIWQALYDNHADVVLNGHDHDYERFAPQTPSGALDNANGIVEFVVGTGGKEQRSFATIRANSLVRSNTSFGLLKLTLHAASYDWQFVPIPGNTLNDAGTASCVTGTPNQAPTATITAPADGASFAQGASVAFSGTGNDPENGALTGASLVWTSSRDGQIGTGTSFTKTTLTAGTHTITLTARDAQGATGTAAVAITIVAPSNQPPTASFTYACGKGNSRQCSFDASGSTDDTGIATYAWSWGDGTSETKTTATAKHQWAARGTYNVTLTVTDRGGLTASVTKAVVVP